MTQERFVQFLENPEALSLISYEEMKTLALAYPYAHNLRYLLALKSQQMHHPDAARNLAAAAAHSLDRTRLFAWIAMPQLAPQRVVEEVLELKPIESIRQELEALSPLIKEEVPEKQAFASASPAPVAAPMPPAREEQQEAPPVHPAVPDPSPAPVAAPMPPAREEQQEAP
ncbi:MAG TPA: hypothetical protein PK971_16965, partial [Saprospiraceae bacterium]|nr:hypothetical protein [Saprospiraceae bacterium]